MSSTSIDYRKQYHRCPMSVYRKCSGLHYGQSGLYRGYRGFYHGYRGVHRQCRENIVDILGNAMDDVKVVQITMIKVQWLTFC